jgi:hypothetical protein
MLSRTGVVRLSTKQNVERSPPRQCHLKPKSARRVCRATCAFRDLRNAGIVDNWEQLRNLVADYHFPPGMLLSPNTRVWDIEDVRAWLASRPSERKKVVAA